MIFPDVRSLDSDAERLCRRLQEQARVALVPGLPRWFGEGSAGHVRICFATSRGILAEAFDRVDRMLPELAAEKPGKPAR